MRGLIARWALMVCFVCVALVVAARAAGRAMPRTLLAYTNFEIETSLYGVSIYEPAIGLTLRLRVGDANASRPTWSVDGRLAFAAARAANSDIYVWDGSRITNITQTPDLSEDRPQWSADGRLAYTSYDGTMSWAYIWDGAVLERLLLGEREYSGEVVWSGDGRLAYESTRDGNIEIYVWDGEREQNVSQNHDALDNNAAWSADGRLAYAEFGYLSDYTELYVWDGSETRRITREFGLERVTDLRWSEDGRLAIGVLISDDSGVIYVWDGARFTEVNGDDFSSNFQPSWTADSILSFNAANRDSEDIYLWDGATVRNVTQTPLVDELFPMWSADGWLVTAVYPTAFEADLYLWNGSESINISRSPLLIEFGAAWWTP